MPRPPDPAPDCLLISERELLRTYLPVSRPTLCRLRREGAIPHLRVGRRVLYVREEIVAWIAARQVGARAES